MISQPRLISLVLGLTGAGVLGVPFCFDQLGEPVVPVVNMIEYGVVAIRLSDIPNFGSQCSIRVTRWSGETLPTPSNYALNACSGTVLVKSADFDMPFISNEDCDFSMMSTDSSGNELCGSATVSFVIPSLDCNAGLLLSRPDAVSVVAKFPPAIFNSGLCKVWISGFNEYEYDEPNIIESGGCHEEFKFESDRQNISLLTGSNVSFGYSYMFDGVHAECKSTGHSFTLPVPSCSQVLEVVKTSGPILQLAISHPQPIEGSCHLVLLSCEGANPLPEGIILDMPSCKRPYDISFAFVQSLLPSAIPGQSCTFSWGYKYGTNTCNSPQNVTTPPIREVCSVREPSKASGSITMSPSVTTTLVGGSCQMALLGCDGKTLSSPVVKQVASCASSETVVFTSTDSSIVGSDSTCFFELQQLPAGHAFGSSSEYSCSSGTVSFTSSTIPRWIAQNDLTSFTLHGSECVEVFWEEAHVTGGSPILCYLVWRKDGSGRWYLVQDCGQSKAGSRKMVSCGMQQSIPIQFKIYAVNRNGISEDPVYTEVIRFEFFQAAPASILLSPLSPGPYISGSFPLIAVQAMHPTLPDPVIDTDTVDRVFVAQLTRLTSPDPSSVNTLNLDSEANFTILTTVLEPDRARPGQYLSSGIDFVPVGNHSLVVSSLEIGGLLAEYWTNVFFQGTPALARKDKQIAFDWTNAPIINDTRTELVVYDLVSIRWTGFLKPSFSEVYTFSFETSNYLRVWFQNDIAIDSWIDRCEANCSFSKELNRSTYYPLRVDFYVSRGFGQSQGGDIGFYWESYSQAYQLVPAIALFKSAFIQHGQFVNLTVIPDLLSAAHSAVFLPNTPIIAGQPFSVFVQARDEFEQNRTSSIEDLFACTLASDAASFTALSMPAIGTSHDGFYEIPFQLTVAGSYRVSITDVNGHLLPNQSLNVTVVPAPAEEIVSASVTVQAEKVANQSVRVTAILRDEFGNTLNGSIADTTFPNLRLGVRWDFDSVSLDRLGASHHDNYNRTKTQGMTFVSLSTEWDGDQGVFVTSVIPLLSGAYNEVELTLPDSRGLFSPALLSPWIVNSSSTVGANNSVVTTSPFPPPNMVAGQAIFCEVQLRDAFKNVINMEPLGLWTSSPVRIKLYRDPDVLKVETCNAKIGVPGVFECTITPTVSGEVEVSVLVNGLESSIIPDQSAGPVPIITGPWKAAVSPAPLDPLQTIVYRLRPSYLISDGPNGELRVLFRDSMSNLITDLQGHRPNITVEFLRQDKSVAMALDPSTFVFEGDGSLTITFFSRIPSSLGSPWTLVMTVDGVEVPIPHPLVEFKGGAPFAAQCSCTVGALQVAGTPFTVRCTVRDWLGNLIDQSSGFFVKMEAVLNDFGTPMNYMWDAAYDASTQYIGTRSLALAGTYQIYARIGQSGGLIAKYYADASFSNLVFPSGAPMSDGQILYSKIDDSLEHRWDGAMAAGSVSARSAEWIGWILPPGPITVRLIIKVNGGLRLRLGQAVLIDQLSNIGAISMTIDHSFLSLEPEEIHIQYVPYGAKFAITWRFPDLDGGPGFSIPKSALLAPLAMPMDNPIIELSEGPISRSSTISVPLNALVQQKPDFFIIQTMDEFGNKVSELPACLSGVGVAPACLFDIFLDQPDGTPTPIITFISDGIYRVDITFASSGPKLVHVQLITGPSPTDRVELAGSPFQITVSNA